jgi:hypothetical protein
MISRAGIAQHHRILSRRAKDPPDGGFLHPRPAQ